MEKSVLDFGVKQELIAAFALRFAPSTETDNQRRRVHDFIWWIRSVKVQLF